MVVVDDQRLIRESTAALLGIQPGITVVGTAGDGQAAVEVVAAEDGSARATARAAVYARDRGLR